MTCGGYESAVPGEDIDAIRFAIAPYGAKRGFNEEFVCWIPAFAGMACGDEIGAVPGEDIDAIRLAIAPYGATALDSRFRRNG